MSLFRLTRIRRIAAGIFTALAVTVSFSAAQASTLDEVRRIIIEESKEALVPSSLALAVAQVESGLRPDHQGADGARGVFQILPVTAKDLGVEPRELWKTRTNVRVGLKVLDDLLGRAEDRWDEALRTYASLRPKSGHKNVARYINNVFVWERRFAEHLTAQDAGNEDRHKVLMSENGRGYDDWKNTKENEYTKPVETVVHDAFPQIQPETVPMEPEVAKLPPYQQEKPANSAWTPASPSPIWSHPRPRKTYRPHLPTSRHYGLRSTRLSRELRGPSWLPRFQMSGSTANPASAVPEVVEARITLGSVNLGREQIRHLVVREARHIGVPAALALAVAKVESDFKARAHSHKGARGVMQIMPRTSIDEYGIAPGLLWNPRINVRLGLHFLRKLIIRYRGRVDLALSHYNGGSAVGILPHARVIPATRQYVEKVQHYQRQFSVQLKHEGDKLGHLLAGKSGSGRG